MNVSKPASVDTLVDHLFRHEAGKMVSVLTRLFGSDNMELAEDVVQEAMLKALRDWRFNQVPPNPTAWLYRVAKNKAIDIIRRKKYSQNFADDLSARLRSEWLLSTTVDQLFLETEIKDSQLRMIFTCCHPALALESQIALTLKTLCGFGSREIARALLANEETVNKRIYRAKQRIKADKIKLEIPVGNDLAPRVDAVHRTIYLLFNEGYNSGSEDVLIRKDLCAEAVRLAELLAEHRYGKHPTTCALLALMHFHMARFDARIDGEGGIVLLHEQDRRLWDYDIIARGFEYFSKSTDGEEASDYHLEAGIAAHHCVARCQEETNWPAILAIYDLFITQKNSPVLQLNRAIVIGQIYGASRAIQEIQSIDDLASLESYYLLQATLGELFLQDGQFTTAKRHLEKAATLTSSGPEKALIQKKLEKCSSLITSQ